MPVEVTFDTPLAAAINTAIQPKLQEVGWASESDASSLAELIVLMLANGKSEEEIATEMAVDLLHLEPGDATAREFSRWLFQQIDELNALMNAPAPSEGGDVDMDTESLNAPTGPRAMRNGQRGGRGGRMLGNLNRAMDRTDVLHRVRQNGNERINTHNRQGQRGRGGRMNPRNMHAGLAAGGPQQWMMGAAGGPQSQAEILSILEHQNQMMFQLSQMMNNAPNGGGFGRGRGGKSLFDRVQDPNRRQRKPHNGHQDNGENNAEGGEDTDMSSREPLNPDETICKYNLRCTNKECKFAHQSPAAPPGASVDVHDPCSFGAACKNRKCVGRHPSPATKLAHQSEQDCKFFPNCQNTHCPFRHPSMPLCRNGAGCTTEGCKFTHVKTKCKFNPCLNPHCAFSHEEGQQGGFKDKVWTAGGGDEHVSDRKFVEDGGSEELVKPDDEMKNDTNHAVPAKAEADEDVIG
ncbi:nuclear polyadenylated RNA-binding protein Nab2 [Cordyceps fumosorosea ARSEF 2679]|uniref:Nuclear polyadenylated RNA-binding protein Nab2 n=1 Tax=Cordyceps fumosorosea (strain ARSEF 2679) TaxID=1081104 RepID=A0A167WM42_CORFA|nr:nuclear polyadenylated RNA-binding protein Nab2 [Cordyceps fumosorosea ARSEF 2679]OAA63961.1 nuclear polyadenylated RNA-binding protein Nab2 [Cordyceps fumosorosea ARSEF 2679]